MLARRYGLGKQLIDMAFGATGPAPPLEVTRVRWGRRNYVRRDGFMSGDTPLARPRWRLLAG
jgi:hypothetical protein